MTTSTNSSRTSGFLGLPRLIRFVQQHAAWTAMLLGLMLTAGASYYASLAFNTEADARFDQHARRVGNAIQQRMNTYLNTLVQTRGFFQASTEVTREDFRAYVDGINVLQQYPGVQGIGFAKRVPANLLTAHLREVRSEGFPAYRVWPEFRRDVYFPIIYLEPFDWRNQRAFGYDMTTEPVRREAMMRAATTGNPAMSGRVKLVQETDSDAQPGFLIYVPVYREGAVLSSPEQRWQALIGFVYSPFRVRDLFSEALKWESEHVENVRVDVYDGDTLSAQNLLHSISSAPGGRVGTRSSQMTLQVGGHVWTVVAADEPGFVTETERAAPVLVFVVGSILSFLLFLIFRAEQERGVISEEARHKLAAVLESIQDNFVSLDRDWNFTYVNRAAARALGRQVEELLGRNVVDEFQFVPGTRTYPALLRAAEQQEVVHVEEYIEHFHAWFEVHAYPAEEGISIYFRDVTEKKRSEEAARQARERFRTAFANANVGMAVVSPDGRLLEANSAYWRITGYGEADAAKINFFDLTHPEDRALVMTLTGRLVRGEIPNYNVSKRYVRKDGRVVWVDSGLSVVRDEAGKAINLIAISQDITQRKRAEQSLAAERERLAVTLLSIADGVITTDVKGRVMLINKAAQSMTGWSQDEAAGKPLQDVFGLWDSRTQMPVSNLFARLLGGGQILPAGDCRLRSRNGDERAVSLTTSPIHGDSSLVLGMVLVFRDVTEQAKTEQELIKTRNLEALGVLAGGIAHDFNNILTAILGNLTLAKLYSVSGGAANEILDEAEKASLRARELTQQLLTFAKGGMPIKKTASIADVVKETTIFALRGSPVRAELRISPELWPAEFDASQMSQVISNLVVNAREAMPKGGAVTVSVDNTMLESNQVPGLSAGDYIRVQVQDRGVGIPEENISRVFDPYFTTKPHGSGIGLATAYSIIKRHGGRISVESHPGQGALFTILLPAARHNALEPEAAPITLPSGSGRVLVMDDEEPVRHVACKLLEHLGYEVTAVGDGAEALQLYRAAQKSGQTYNAVILDLTVPGGMGGQECLQQLREADPAVKAIVSSGYSTDPIMANYRNYGFQGRIVKPYQVSELSGVLAEVMSEINIASG